MKYYTGVGSRSTPPHILAIITKIAMKLDTLGYTLRSGGAKGADTAFEIGALNKNIYYARDATDKAMQIASQFHPNWTACSQYTKMLHGRNAFQVLGKDLNHPSTFLLCWTPDGCIDHNTRTRQTGGTGTAISIANAHNVPVSNLGIADTLKDWTEWLKK